ncbi:hypothetical protein GCM10009425_48370 [Pseudomonas asuensis]|uniref:Uncharacterized protein n=1 Tax=Pseudomonas asuensis TaxID=1825787 RepID=A0ABQ2H5W1_9PSED|nr:hypothetical protein GCM10009425_48370 [Pseudomonas asuensis]
MESIRSGTAYNTKVSSTNPAQGTQAATGTHPSGHDRSLTSSMLSDHSVAELNAKETQGTEQEKALARFAKEAIGRGHLQLAPNQQPNSVA